MALIGDNIIRISSDILGVDLVENSLPKYGFFRESDVQPPQNIQTPEIAIKTHQHHVSFIKEGCVSIRSNKGSLDLDRGRAESFCREFCGRVYPAFDDILADPAVDAILNLTIHHAHFELNSRALRAGKHVFSEKPMALSHLTYLLESVQDGDYGSTPASNPVGPEGGQILDDYTVKALQELF